MIDHSLSLTSLGYENLSIFPPYVEEKSSNHFIYFAIAILYAESEHPLKLLEAQLAKEEARDQEKAAMTPHQAVLKELKNPTPAPPISTPSSPVQDWLAISGQRASRPETSETFSSQPPSDTDPETYRKILKDNKQLTEYASEDENSTEWAGFLDKTALFQKLERCS